MISRSSAALCVLLLGLLCCTAGCTQGQPAAAPQSPVPTSLQPAVTAAYTSNETLEAFVNRAVAYVGEQGTQKALAEFNRKNGSFMQGELYIYAYGFNGTTLAHPVNPEMVGKKRTDSPVIASFVQEMGGVVRNGSHYYRFTYINPAHNNTLESKLGYGVRINDEWWLGSGVYTGPVVTPAMTAQP